MFVIILVENTPTPNTTGATRRGTIPGEMFKVAARKQYFAAQVALNSTLPKMLLNEMFCWIQILELGKYYIEGQGSCEVGTLVKNHWSIESHQHLSDLVFK